MKVALVYDRVNKWGGAERVLLTLHEMFPQAPLYTSVYEPTSAKWANVFPQVYTSFLQGLTLRGWRAHHEWLAPLMPLAFEQFFFDEYDLVISVTSEAAKGIITKPKTLHVCLCLTPTRYLWSGYEDYFKSKWLKVLSKPVVNYLRTWDKIASTRPDVYIAISKEVQKRIKKYYGRESEVIYPPIWRLGRVRKFSSQQLRTSSSIIASGAEQGADSENFVPSPRHDYFLIVSRLVPYKRIDIAIEAFNILGWPLKIIGTGVEQTRLKKMAKSNIDFLQNLTDGELVSYYENCRALIVPGAEDFGLAILEAQSVGRPVIAFKAGGALETVVEGKTGKFFTPQAKEALTKVLKDFNNKDYRQEDCIKNAQKFSKERFVKELLTYL